MYDRWRHSRLKRLCQLQWRYPIPGFVKLVVDGSINSDSDRFGKGAVCRDHHGVCLDILTTPGLGFPSPLTCETMALVNGLHFCLQAGFSHSEVEGDAQMVFKALAALDEDLSPDGELVKKAKFSLGLFQSVSWGSVPRNSNKATHCVANSALSLPYPTFWSRMTPEWLS